MEQYFQDEKKKNKLIQEMKVSLEKDHGREFSLEEAAQAVHDLETLSDILFESAMKEIDRQEKLKTSPKGFHLSEESGTCLICGKVAVKENSWYDIYGIKCMVCQEAINKKIIPASIAKNKDTWYSKFDLESYFNIEGPFLRKCIKQGLLKDRVILDLDNKNHFQLFLMKDNKGILPPKKLLKSRIVSVERNGEQFQTLEYWYEFIDIKLARKLLKYKVMEILAVSLAKPIKGGQFYFKKINPIFSYNK